MVALEHGDTFGLGESVLCHAMLYVRTNFRLICNLPPDPQRLRAGLRLKSVRHAKLA